MEKPSCGFFVRIPSSVNVTENHCSFLSECLNLLSPACSASRIGKDGRR